MTTFINSPRLKRLLFALASRAIARVEAGSMAVNRALHAFKYQCFLRLIHRPRVDDIFIVSYPKAGTTVMQMMVHNIVGDGSMDFEHIDAVVPWFENRYLQDSRTYDSLPSPRAFKTHRTFDRLPRNASYIYLLRNPKDSCVSYYFHMMSSGWYGLALQNFVAQFLLGTSASGSWFEHMEACCHPRRGERILLVSYDDIANDLGGVVDRVSTFCGSELDPQKRAKVIERCSFNFMKRHNEKFDPRNATKPRNMQKTEFIRNGASGDWVHHLSPALASEIDQRCEKTLVNVLPFLTERHMKILRPPAPRLRGTLAVEIGAGHQGRLLVETEDAVIPWGIRMAANGQPLQVGDAIRLKVSWERGVGIVVQRAEVASVEEGMMDLRLAGLEAADATQLREYCSAAGRSIRSCVPDRDYSSSSRTLGEPACRLNC